MALLPSIHSPKDLKPLSREQLRELADEMRAFLIDSCSRTGGHIGAGLGVVELSIALHAAFDAPADQIVWDVGHQAYPHKLLTGRMPLFHTLRQEGGMSGFLKRSESEYDSFGAGHAGTAISSGLGMAAARDLNGESFKVVSVLGDGALTCGLSYEGLNNAGASGRDFIVVLNDNEMSIAPNVGAISKYLTSVQRNPLYNRLRSAIGSAADSMPGALHVVVDVGAQVGRECESVSHPRCAVRRARLPLFRSHRWPRHRCADRYVRRRAHDGRPTLRARHNPEREGVSRWGARREVACAPPGHDPATGKLVKSSSSNSAYTAVFGKGLVELAALEPKLVAITAAMPSGTGTTAFAKAYPNRFFDVGIAEGHAVTFAAGMATRGVRPVCAIYSTFLQRGYDSIVHDVAIQNLPVVFAMDRAGLVGEDGPTHMGLYDIAYMLAVPGMTVTAPKDSTEMLALLRAAVRHDGPFSLRYPRDAAPDMAPPIQTIEPTPYGTWEVLRRGTDVAILAVGTMVLPSLAAADALAADGLSVTVVNCRYLKPHDEVTLNALLANHRQLLVVEEGAVVNGFGAYMSAIVARTDSGARVVAHGVPDHFIEQASRSRQLAIVGLDAAGIADRVRALHDSETEAVAL